MGSVEVVASAPFYLFSSHSHSSLRSPSMPMAKAVAMPSRKGRDEAVLYTVKLQDSGNTI